MLNDVELVWLQGPDYKPKRPLKWLPETNTSWPEIQDAAHEGLAFFEATSATGRYVFDRVYTPEEIEMLINLCEARYAG